MLKDKKILLDKINDAKNIILNYENIKAIESNIDNFNSLDEKIKKKILQMLVHIEVDKKISNPDQ
jgi:hypothetical protein